MIKIFLINYDLNKAGQNYNCLIDEIKRCQDWIKYLDSGWMIATTESSSQVYFRLSKWIDANDNILITELPAGYYGYLNQSVWDWLKKYGK